VNPPPFSIFQPPAKPAAGLGPEPAVDAQLGRPGRWHSGNVSDQTVQLIRYFSKVPLGAPAEFQGVVEHLGVFAEHSGLTPFDLPNPNQRVLRWLARNS
jgi:hypothetical protein